MIALLIFTFNLKDEYDVVDDDLIDTEPIPKYSPIVLNLKKQELFDLKYSNL